MKNQEKQLIELLRRRLSPEIVNKSIIFIDDQEFSKGSKVEFGKVSFSFSFDGFMVFVDLEPELNWTHDCLYFFISRDLSELKEVKANTPPYHGNEPDSYSVFLRYGSIPEDRSDFNPFRH